MTGSRNEWRVARYVRVRSAGFAYQLLAPLAQPGTVQSLRELEDSWDPQPLARQIESVVHDDRQSARTRVRTRIASLRKRLRRATSELEPVEPGAEAAAPGRAAELEHLVAIWNRHAKARRERLAAIENQFDVELEAARRYLWHLMGEHQMRDAVFFSSPQVATTLASTSPPDLPLPPRSSTIRKLERTATMFVQRFCAKNDSISYYGPIYWGVFDGPEAEKSIDARFGEHLISRRLISLEHWASAAIAAALCADPELEPYLATRLRPSYRVDGERLVKADGSVIELGAKELAVVRAAADHATVGAQRREPSLQQAFHALLARKIVAAGFVVPTMPHGRDAVLEQLLALPACPSRTRWLETIQQLRAKLDAFVALPHEEHEQRRHAFLALEQWFEATVGEAARRSPGKMYAGRSIVFEDCERGIEHFTIGNTLARELIALGPLLDLCEWTSAALGAREHDRFLGAWRALAADGARSVPLLRLYDAAQRNDGPMMSELHARRIETQLEITWERYLDEHHPGWREAAEISLAPDALDAILASLPPAARFPDRNVRVHSPDVMIASPSLDALNAGDYQIVLGELHKAVFTIAVPWACALMPDVALLERDFVDWCGTRPLLDLAPPDDNRSATNWPDFACHWQVDHEAGVTNISPERLVPIAELEATLHDGLLYVQRVGRPETRFFLLECVRRDFVRYLLTVDPVSLPGKKTPRLTWGKVVLLRRRWRFDPDEYPSLDAHGFELFREIRRWAVGCGLPEHVFVRVPLEPKPLFVDFGNYHTIEMLAKQLRSADRATFSEMLPGRDGLWLTDRGGTDRYTCELRFTMYRPSK